MTSVLVNTTSNKIFSRFESISSKTVSVKVSPISIKDSDLNINRMDLRMAILTVGLKLFIESPVIGYGTGDVKDVLINGY